MRKNKQNYCIANNMILLNELVLFFLVLLPIFNSCIGLIFQFFLFCCYTGIQFIETQFFFIS